jgi:hypothetical protein
LFGSDTEHVKRIIGLCVAIVALAAACASENSAATPTAAPEAPGDKDETAYAGVATSRAVLELDGGVQLMTDGMKATWIEFGLALAAGADPMAITGPHWPIEMTYIDSDVVVVGLAYSVAETEDGDAVLERGETASIRIDLAAACPACAIGAEHTFTLEIKPPNGSYLVIQRTTPAELGTSIDLD